MSVAQQTVGVTGTIADVMGSGELPNNTKGAQVVTHRPDDPLLTALAIDTAITGQALQLALNQNVLNAVAGPNWIDVSACKAIAVAITPAPGTVTAGVITFEGSNDGINVVPMLMVDKAAMANIPVSVYTVVASTTRFFLGNVFFKYFRARISTALTGTTTGVQAFSMLLSNELSFAIQHVRLGDGVNVAAIKAASTVAAVADPSQVVSISPNLPTLTPVNGLAAATNNAAFAKATAGNVFDVELTNYAAAVRYFKFYNKATAPAPATDAALLVWVIPIPAGTSVAFNLGTFGKRFTTGIAFACVTGVAEADNTSTVAGDVRWSFGYN